MSRAPSVVSGAVSGATAAIAFTWVHDLVISDIWDMIGPMVVAGALAGASLAWTHRRLVADPSLRTWVGLNGVFLLLFGLLGLWSVVVFDPITTVAEMPTDEPPHALIARALPSTIVFTLVAVGLVTRLFGGGWRDAWSVLATTIVLMLTLGLNVSIIGLVEFSGGDALVVAEVYALILVLAVVHTAVAAGITRRRATRPQPTT